MGRLSGRKLLSGKSYLTSTVFCCCNALKIRPVSAAWLSVEIRSVERVQCNYPSAEHSYITLLSSTEFKSALLGDCLKASVHLIEQCWLATFKYLKQKNHKSYKLQAFCIITQRVKLHMHVTRAAQLISSISLTEQIFFDLGFIFQASLKSNILQNYKHCICL